MSEQDKKFYATSAFLMIDDLKKENEELKHRIEKANEYIKRHIQPDSFEGYLDSYEISNLLNILQNGSDDK